MTLFRQATLPTRVGASGMPIGNAVTCRAGCGACCIAPSISTLHKPAGEACKHLTPELRCSIFGAAQRPACCSGLQPSTEMCGSDRDAALAWLAQLEAATAAC